MTARSIALILFVTAAFTVACESTRVTEPEPPPVDPPVEPAVFTTLEVSPSTVTLEQGLEVQLAIVARDQRGDPIQDYGQAIFTSSDPTVATVHRSGVVTAVATGTADISVTKSISGVTRSAGMTAIIRAATPSADLVLIADMQRGWQPSVTHLASGGTVTWKTAGPRSWGDTPHGKLFLMDKAYTVVDSLDLSSGSATRKLVTVGEYRYCSASCWDPPDYGVVYVH